MLMHRGGGGVLPGCVGEQDFGEAADAFGCSCLDDVDGGGHVGGVGVDVVDGYAGADVAEEGCCGVDAEGGAYDDEDVGFGGELRGGLELGDGFLEEDDVGPDVVAADDGVGGGALAGPEGEDEGVVVDGADFA